MTRVAPGMSKCQELFDKSMYVRHVDSARDGFLLMTFRSFGESNTVRPYRGREIAVCVKLQQTV